MEAIQNTGYNANIVGLWIVVEHGRCIKSGFTSREQAERWIREFAGQRS